MFGTGGSLICLVSSWLYQRRVILAFDNETECIARPDVGASGYNAASSCYFQPIPGACLPMVIGSGSPNSFVPTMRSRCVLPVMWRLDVPAALMTWWIVCRNNYESLSHRRWDAGFQYRWPVSPSHSRRRTLCDVWSAFPCRSVRFSGRSTDILPPAHQKRLKSKGYYSSLGHVRWGDPPCM